MRSTPCGSTLTRRCVADHSAIRTSVGETAGRPPTGASANRDRRRDLATRCDDVEVAGRYGKIANAVAWNRLNLAKLYKILRCGDQTTLVHLPADGDGRATSARELDDGGRISHRRSLGQHDEFADGERKWIRPIPVGIERGCRWRAEQNDRQVVGGYRAIEHQDAGFD